MTHLFRPENKRIHYIHCLAKFKEDKENAERNKMAAIWGGPTVKIVDQKPSVEDLNRKNEIPTDAPEIIISKCRACQKDITIFQYECNVCGLYAPQLLNNSNLREDFRQKKLEEENPQRQELGNHKYIAPTSARYQPYVKKNTSKDQDYEYYKNRKKENNPYANRYNDNYNRRIRDSHYSSQQGRYDTPDRHNHSNNYDRDYSYRNTTNSGSDNYRNDYNSRNNSNYSNSNYSNNNDRQYNSRNNSNNDRDYNNRNNSNNNNNGNTGSNDGHYLGPDRW
eukprot:CAMPEP_0174268134 /NCGR_PEP_ID=MMETSP0439-20130205/36306_1 /TAXON_ID=0 /ORGANISM="Stereomyxa ramosa, Strain Chinc5" /LENGTH=278 /DNA_ID=CAMNT_0015356123 /DNA_START=162 /DNA_END=995 /DNA_ORIENTATION=+